MSHKQKARHAAWHEHKNHSYHCLFCGSRDDVQLHHEDYYRPLDVTPLCRNCHLELHRMSRSFSRHECLIMINNNYLIKNKLVEEKNKLEGKSFLLDKERDAIDICIDNQNAQLRKLIWLSRRNTCIQ